MKPVQLICASANALPIEDESVQCVVTSPPYWGLRAYAGEQRQVWGGDADYAFAGDDRDFMVVCDLHFRDGAEGMIGDLHGAVMALARSDVERYESATESMHSVSEPSTPLPNE